MSSLQGDQFRFIYQRGRIQLYVQLSRGSLPSYSSQRGGSSYISSYQEDQQVLVYVQLSRGFVPFSSLERGGSSYISSYQCPAIKGMSSFLQLKDWKIQLYSMSSYQEDQFLFIVHREEDLAICSAINGISSFLQFRQERIQLYVHCPAIERISSFLQLIEGKIQQQDIAICPDIKGSRSFLQLRQGRIQLHVHLPSQQGDQFLYIVRDIT